MKVTIFGTGYVGLVQAAVLADVGHEVCCVDVDEAKVEGLKNGVIPIYEPGLENLVVENFREGRLVFTTDAQAGVNFGQIIFIAVGTPPEEDGSADLQYVLAVAATVAEHMNESKILVDKSTVPVGTANKVRAAVKEGLDKRGADLDFDVVSNPEFLKEGAAVNDCKRPDRIIIGTESEETEKVMRELYQPFNRNHEKIIVMDTRSAEMTKYAANCMLATKISFMNEMANIAEIVGADIEHVRQGIGSDERIGYHFIYPGCGYGGSCFPKDVRALVKTSSEVGYSASILQSVEQVNDAQKQTLFQKLARVFNDELSGKTIALWGLSFKPETDDMREASSRTLIEALWQAGAKVVAYDPKASAEATRIYGRRPNFSLAATKELATQQADALVIATEWKEFRSPNFDQLKNDLNYPVIIDGRNLYSPQKMKSLGFLYFGVGRGESISKSPVKILKNLNQAV